MPAIPGLRTRRLALFGAAIAATVVIGPVPAAYAAAAPGAPGANATWTTGAKQAFASATGTTSKLWYTLGSGILNEVYYPQTDNPDVRTLQFLVTDGSSFTDAETTGTTHVVNLPDQQSLTWQQVNTASNGKYTITKTYAADPARSVLLIHTTFQNTSSGPLSLYVHYDPSLANSGMGDTGGSSGGQLVATDGAVSSALAASTGFSQLTSGYSGTSSDGSSQLAASHTLTATYDSAPTAGNLVQTAQIPVAASGSTTFDLALGFGSSQSAASAAASASLTAGWTSVLGSFQSGWHSYLSGIAPAPASVSGTPALLKQYNVALMELKADEDKTYIGAFVASPTIPWGDAQNANDCCGAGYHAVWARDQYEMATALLSAGDTASANEALDYLYGTQERSDGSYPQNTRLDGTPVWGSLQMDEVADPIILDWQLGRFGAADWAKVKASADYLVAHGPYTPEERWEEAGGFSPATIAAEIAGLVCAADIATRNGDSSSAASYLATADNWHANVDSWTYTTSGSLTGGQYYERIDNDQNPNDGASLSIANGGGNWDERNVVDTSFLELVRLGVKSPTDYHITNSITTVDATIKTNTPEGPMWHRYNHDGYGETSSGAPYTGAGVGRDWPVFTGERGEYDMALGDTTAAQSMLATMAGSANQGFQIPEQVWDQASAYGFTFGQGTGSATPLEWSLAQFVRLAQNISAGHNVETPSVVTDRYAGGGGTGQVAETFTVSGAPSGNVYLVGSIAELGSWNTANAIAMTQSGSSWTTTVNLPVSTAIEYKYIIKASDGSVTWEQDPNHSATTGSGSTASLDDTWHGSTSTVAVTFNENATTSWGQNVYVVGSIPALGSWNTGSAVALSSAGYPVWSATVSIPSGTYFEYKYIKKNPDGSITWESDPNRSYTTGSGGTATLNDSWR